MSWLRRFLYFVRPAFGYRRLNADIGEEIEGHLERATEANMARGMPAAEARVAAEREFGRPAQAAELYRDARGISWTAGWAQDVCHAWRSLMHARIFTVVTTMTLALGIGSAAAIFSVVDWALFRAASFPKDVVLVGATNKQGQFRGDRFEVHVQAYREQARTFSDFGLAHAYPFNIALDGEPVANGVTAISANLLPMLGVAPVLGRNFIAGEDVPERGAAAIISDAFWRSYFHGDPDVLGRTLTIDAWPCVVVGVLGPGQKLPPNLKTEVFVQLAVPPVFKTVGYSYLVFGKLRPGVTPQQADDDLAAIKVPLPERIAIYNAFTKPHVETMAQLQAVQRSETYWVLVGAVGFLYAIACLNATNLMLVRLLGRRRELGIRLALGGSHWRLIRLLVVESLMLSSLASVAGVLLANWLAPLLMLLLEPGRAFHWAHWSLDLRAIGILVLLAGITCLMVVVVPAWRILRSTALSGLKDGSSAAGDSPVLGRLRQAIVVLQAVFAVILLTGTGLMVRTLAKLEQVSLGFDDRHLIKAQVAFPEYYTYRGPEQMPRLERLREHLERVPGVASVAYGMDSLVRGTYDDKVSVATADGAPVRVELDFVSPNFIETAGIALKAGRIMRRTGSEVLINETFARTMFGAKNPIGQVLRPVEGGATTAGWFIVGVVGDVRDVLRSTPGNHLYAPVDWFAPSATTLLLKVRRAPDGELAAAIRRALYAFDPRIVVSYVAPMPEVVGWQSKFERFVVLGLEVLSAIALVLTIGGLFAVLAYTVDRRMGEFGVRLVLGTTPRDIAGLVLRSSLLTVLLGTIGGAAGAVGLSQFLRSLLYQTVPYDPWVLGTVAVVLIASAFVASLLPAYRAARADVARLLRAE